MLVLFLVFLVYDIDYYLYVFYAGFYLIIEEQFSKSQIDAVIKGL